MVPIVQLVRASDCGSECRGFESHWAPKEGSRKASFFCVRWGENPQGSSSTKSLERSGSHRRSRWSEAEVIDEVAGAKRKNPTAIGNVPPGPVQKVSTTEKRRYKK